MTAHRSSQKHTNNTRRREFPVHNDLDYIIPKLSNPDPSLASRQRVSASRAMLPMLQTARYGPQTHPILTRTNPAQVQGEAQGSEDALKEFVQHLNKGPSAAKVSGVEQSDISTKSDESGFTTK
jgi:hypothetical protein